MAIGLLPALGRVLLFAKEAFDWISFANEAFSFVGLTKRAAAVAATGATIAGTGMAVTGGVKKVVREVQVTQMPFEIPAPTSTTDGVIPWGRLLAPGNEYLMASLESECNSSRLSTDAQCAEVLRAKIEQMAISNRKRTAYMLGK